MQKGGNHVVSSVVAGFCLLRLIDSVYQHVHGLKTKCGCQVADCVKALSRLFVSRLADIGFGERPTGAPAR